MLSGGRACGLAGVRAEGSAVRRAGGRGRAGQLPFLSGRCAPENRALSADGTLAATAGVYALQPWEAYIGAVETAPAFRRRGCAGYLVSLLAHTYAQRPVRLICAEDMVPFYAKLGFARDGLLCDCVRTDT